MSVEIKTLGLPIIHKENKEIRAFSPTFLDSLTQYDVDVCLEEGYGEKMGYTKEEYLNANNRVRYTNNKETYQQDLVIVLRAPNNDEIFQMKKNAGLLSMLHYKSRPDRTALIHDKRINCFSLDAIVDDKYDRMVVTYEQTAWNGVSTALNEMKRRRNDFFSPSRAPYKVTILGMGKLGIHAGRACFKYAMETFQNCSKNIPGITVTYVEQDTTHFKKEIEKIISETDLLIDATQRADFSEYIITNDMLASLKEESCILDLTADHYDDTKKPIQVKGIEGLPYGTLDKYIFDVDAAEYADIPREVKTDNRRITISCNSWPGVFPKKCMKTYEGMLAPFIKVLINKGFNLSLASDDLYERALYRSTLDFFEKSTES
jgi:alanine dehydrogenase